jgi:hypothetical protein
MIVDTSAILAILLQRDVLHQVNKNPWSIKP